MKRKQKKNFPATWLVLTLPALLFVVIECENIILQVSGADDVNGD